MTGHAAQVLLVEDDSSVRQILARHLRANGYDVNEAASAEDAVTLLAEGVRPAVILLDINLPARNGWDLLRGPSLAAAGSPPVVIASALTIDSRRLTEFGVAEAIPARDAHRDGGATRGDPGMCDQVVLLISLVAGAGLFGLVCWETASWSAA